MNDVELVILEKKTCNRIRYIEVTRERYEHVDSKFKYRTTSLFKPDRFYMARNRCKLERDLEDLK